MKMMDYDDAKSRLIHSKAYDRNYRKAPRVSGYISEAEFCNILELNVSRVARNNGLDSDYVRFLAIAKSIGVLSNDEPEQNLFNRRIDALELIIKDKLEEYVIEDLAYLNGECSTATNEGKAVMAAQEVMEIVSRLPAAEIEKNGGRLLEPTLLDGIQIKETGEVIYCDFLKQIQSLSETYNKQ